MAQKLSKKQIWIGAGAVVVLLLLWFFIRYYGNPNMREAPLFSTDARIEKEINEFKGVIDSLYAAADKLSENYAAAALADDFLSIAEENAAVNDVMANVELLKSQIKYPALMAGYTFQLTNGRSQHIKGFQYGANQVNSVLQRCFNSRGTAVKERELIDKLTSLVKMNTRDNNLDNKEKSICLQMITQPEPGKKAALPSATANRIIRSYCEKNGINMGEKKLETVW